MSSPADVTQLLEAWRLGEPESRERLLTLVYGELRRMAGRQLRRERPDHTLQPTALVHEAYLRLVDQRHVDWKDRAHFFGIAAQVMRRILVDHARRRQAHKRGDGAQRLPLEAAEGASGLDDFSVLDVDAALDRLKAMDERLATLVELRAFGGLTVDEVAEVTAVSASTVKRDWRTARAWLIRELRLEPPR